MEHESAEPLRPVLIVFAKAPRPGFVKTRLIPRVGAEGACRFHEAFVRDMLQALHELDGLCDVELHTDERWDHWASNGRVAKLQAPGDLGTKMRTALEDALHGGRPLAVILGSDSPSLPMAYVRQILECPTDVCLGPVADGGFYAIACRKVQPSLFDGVTWSSPQTLEQTIAAVTKAGLTVALGPAWYDIDSVDDLDRLMGDEGVRPATAEALRNLRPLR